MRSGRKHVRKGTVEARVVDEYVLRIVRQVVFCDIKHRHRFSHEAGHVISWLECYVTDSERNHAACVAMHHTVLAWITFKDTLVDPPLIKLGLDCARVSGGYWRAITDVVFGEVFGAGDEGGWRLAGHKECAGVEGVADGDMTEAIEYRVAIENMVGCDECREDGGYVDCNHCWMGSVGS